MMMLLLVFRFFFFQAEDGIRDFHVTGVQTCALPIFVVGGEEPAFEEALLMAVVTGVIHCGIRHCNYTSLIQFPGIAPACAGTQWDQTPLSTCSAGAAPASGIPVCGTSASGEAAAGSATGADAGLREASQVLNSSFDTALTTTGMKPWSLPHSSAHWPR